MTQLKALLADKILEVSTMEVEQATKQLSRIRAFRDFVMACSSLMNRYPKLEEEFIKMVENNDFDTRLASARVNFFLESALDGNHTPKENVEESPLSKHSPTSDEREDVQERSAELSNTLPDEMDSSEVKLEENNMPWEETGTLQYRGEHPHLSEEETVEPQGVLPTKLSWPFIIVIAVLGLLVLLLLIIVAKEFLFKKGTLVVLLLIGVGLFVYQRIKKRKA